MTEATMQVFAEYGTIGSVVIGFFVMLAWVLRTSGEREKKAAEREEKLYTIIDSLSSQLPTIREAIERIENKIT